MCERCEPERAAYIAANSELPQLLDQRSALRARRIASLNRPGAEAQVVVDGPEVAELNDRIAALDERMLRAYRVIWDLHGEDHDLPVLGQGTGGSSGASGGS